MIMINKLKFTNKNVIINIYDSVEEVEEDSYFPKGVILIAFWGSFVNHVDTDCMHKQENGLWNAVTMEENIK